MEREVCIRGGGRFASGGRGVCIKGEGVCIRRGGQTPLPPVNRQTCIKTLPCPKLHLRAVTININLLYCWYLATGIHSSVSNTFSIYYNGNNFFRFRLIFCRQVPAVSHAYTFCVPLQLAICVTPTWAGPIPYQTPPGPPKEYRGPEFLYTATTLIYPEFLTVFIAFVSAFPRWEYTLTSLAVRAAHSDLLVQILRYELDGIALSCELTLYMQWRAGGGLY